MTRNPLTIEEIVRLYTVEHLTCAQIGERYGRTRQAVAKRLKQAGVPSALGERVDVRCSHCGSALSVHRKRWHRQMAHFCNSHCHYASLEKGFRPWSQGSQHARAAVARYFKLEQGNIVHHEDRNQRNNEISNLRVFVDQSAHMAYHRGRKIKPLWDGSLLQGLPGLGETLGGALVAGPSATAVGD